jgi:hypothetical protein
MRLDPLYRITFAYRERLGAGDELLLLAEGRCEGRVTGRFRGANRAGGSRAARGFPSSKAQSRPRTGRRSCSG